jgi:hypothetical protein
MVRSRQRTRRSRETAAAWRQQRKRRVQLRRVQARRMRRRVT